VIDRGGGVAASSPANHVRDCTWSAVQSIDRTRCQDSLASISSRISRLPSAWPQPLRSRPRSCPRQSGSLRLGPCGDCGRNSGPHVRRPHQAGRCSWRLRFALWKGADWRHIRNRGRNRGRSHFSKIDQNEFKNGVYISGPSLLNTCVRLRPTGSAKLHLPTTFPAHRKSRPEQWLQRQVTSFDNRPIG